MKYFILIILFFILNTHLALAIPLRLHLTYYPTIEFAGIYYALDQGWYKEAGIDLIPSFKDLNITDNLLSGNYDIAMHSGHEIIRRVSGGDKIKAFAAEYQFNPLSLASLPSVKSLNDLRGKTIGIFTEQEKDFLKIIFNSVNIDLSEVKFKQINLFSVDDLLSDLKKNKYEALPVWAFNHPVAFALKGFNVRQFPSSTNGFNFYGTVFYAHHTLIKSRANDLAKFIEITRRGWDQVFKNPEQAVQNHMKKWYPKDRLIDGNFKLTEKQQLIQLKLSKRYLYEGVGEKRFGFMTSQQWASSIKTAKFNGLIKQTLLPKDVYTDEILKLVELK
ncbi:MAG TPA: ABC transporter substrate-binding protein [Pseudobdellovibrionaceae bacterium]|nr:ABC transporter substrate-binding protein [Pseudobdellovibrionaceae bacterium]